MSNADATCLIVGASHAGSQLAISLRQEGWTGRVVLIGEENHLPYHRPLLSKQFMLGEKTSEQLPIRSGQIYEKHGIQLHLNDRVESIDRKARIVTLASGTTLAWSKLALCLGARNRSLETPGHELSGIYYLRTQSDAQHILHAAAPGCRVVIVGGGYIGLELAAALVKRDLCVTVIERESRLLARVTTEIMSGFFARVHQEEGVQIVSGAAFSHFEGSKKVSAAICADGRRFPADIVIVGVGVEPRTELARQAGLQVDDGIVIDEFGRTSDPDIVAAGDCTRFISAFYGCSLRLESVPNANDQARSAAASICGQAKPYTALPWFWSEQYDVRLQIAGLNMGHDDVVVRGDSLTTRSFSVFYLKKGKVIAADCVNQPKVFMCVKRLIESRQAVEKKCLADDTVPLEENLPV